MNLPIIDMSSKNVVREISAALSADGFMYLRGHAIPAALFQQAQTASQRFFARPVMFKDRFAYSHRGLEANFGFHGVQIERLDPSGAPDLKESFSMRNASAVQADHWPDETFRDAALALYAACVSASYKILNIMAAGLKLPQDFFTARHQGQNLTLRFLHYPAGIAPESASQFGAGAHTDYGSITLLYQDEVGGLEVRGRDDRWHAAPAVADAVLVNTGDLMQRWTNDRFRSTVHRVRPVGGLTDRYSIAFFVDPDADVQVDCIESCATERQPARYPTITAGEHVQAKLAASQTVQHTER
jgi:isopenicillin N synthase-like dioxygenase